MENNKNKPFDATVTISSQFPTGIGSVIDPCCFTLKLWHDLKKKQAESFGPAAPRLSRKGKGTWLLRQNRSHIKESQGAEGGDASV